MESPSWSSAPTAKVMKDTDGRKALVPMLISTATPMHPMYSAGSIQESQSRNRMAKIITTAIMAITGISVDRVSTKRSLSTTPPLTAMP